MPVVTDGDRLLVVFARAPRSEARDKGLPEEPASELFAAIARKWQEAALRCGARIAAACDPLAERHRTVATANDLADSPPPWLSIERRVNVEEIGRDGEEWVVALTGRGPIRVDAVAAFTGYRPDSSFLAELPLETGPGTEGTARLERALSRVTDCLTVPDVRPADFETGEPGFFFAGARSYGRSRNFLLRTGFAHLSAMLDSVAAPAKTVHS
jgi:hypothetical protein